MALGGLFVVSAAKAANAAVKQAVKGQLPTK
jgi:hypothetical protein